MHTTRSFRIKHCVHWPHFPSNDGRNPLPGLLSSVAVFFPYKCPSINNASLRYSVTFSHSHDGSVVNGVQKGICSLPQEGFVLRFIMWMIELNQVRHGTKQKKI